MKTIKVRRLSDSTTHDLFYGDITSILETSNRLRAQRIWPGVQRVQFIGQSGLQAKAQWEKFKYDPELPTMFWPRVKTGAPTWVHQTGDTIYVMVYMKENFTFTLPEGVQLVKGYFDDYVHTKNNYVKVFNHGLNVTGNVVEATVEPLDLYAYNPHTHEVVEEGNPYFNAGRRANLQLELRAYKPGYYEFPGIAGGDLLILGEEVDPLVEEPPVLEPEPEFTPLTEELLLTVPGVTTQVAGNIITEFPEIYTK